MAERDDDRKKALGDYDVGYGRPPRQHRFKAGQSGNPKGRPKGSAHFETLFKEVMNAPMAITRNGRRQHVKTLEAVLLRTLESALKGDPKARADILKLAARYMMQPESAPTDTSAIEARVAEFTAKMTDLASRSGRLNPD